MNIRATALAIAAVFSLSACGSEAAPESEDSVFTAEEGETRETIVLQSPVDESIMSAYEKERALDHERFRAKYSQTDLATLLEESSGSPSWLGSGGREVCDALKSVKLPCDYDTRITLSRFLSVNGKGLFPAMGRTNPYVNSSIDEGYYGFDGAVDDVFIGQPVQNQMLAEAVRKNRDLFENGTLHPEVVRADWR